MVQLSRLLKCLFAAAAVVSLANQASAGPVLNWLGLGTNNPPSSYSPVHYWAPTASRVNDHFHAPRVPIYPHDRHPEVPPSYDVLQFPSNVAVPEQMIFNRPTPPETSKAR